MELKEVMNVMQVSGERIPSGYYKKPEVDAVLAAKDAENRRLKRALYKACANWAMNARMVEIEAKPWGENHESRLWAGVYDKCLKKAEEYK